MLKKLFISFIAIFITATSIFAAPAMAQQESPWYAPTLEDFSAKVDDAPENEIFGERYTQAQVYWIVYSLLRVLVGQDMMECKKVAADITLLDDCVSSMLNSAAGVVPGVNTQSSNPGIILPLASLVDRTIQFRPASGVQYVAGKIDQLNIIDDAYAQEGFGYTTLSPTIKLWTPVRNAAYALMVLAMVVLAFMIMFRTKISPQASLTIQVAIPRLIIALILITFSYAIAGFLIDLAYLILGFIGALFSLGGISTLDAPAMFGGLQNWGNGMVSIGIMMVLYVLAGSVVWTVSTGGTGFGIAFIGAVILLILVIIVYIVALFKILWTMFKSMLTLTMLVVFSPIFIVAGVISSSIGFGSWLKSFIGHLSIFVTVPLFIFFANVIMWGSVGGASVLAPSLFLNPYGIDSTLLAGGMQLPGFFGGYNAIFGMIGGLVLLMSAPKLGGGIRDMIITGRGQFGADLGSYVGPGLMAGGYIAGRKEVGAKMSNDPQMENLWRSVRGVIDYTSKKVR